MHLRFIAIAVVLVCSAMANPFDDLHIFGYDSVAATAATLRVGPYARFTVLTDAVVRMEFSRTGAFEDRATLTIVNRKLPVPKFTAHQGSGLFTLTTATVTLHYAVGSDFTASTLNGTLHTEGVPAKPWAYGKRDDGNLFGTIHSLDSLCHPTLNCTENFFKFENLESTHCAWGVVSRSGWTLIEDTKNYILGGANSSHTQWFDNALRGASGVDQYLFTHGLDFKSALGDFVKIAGQVPVNTRGMSGVWFTRWYDYDTDDVQNIVDTFVRNELPLDVWVFDMNWHKKYGWTGYSWDTELHPYPAELLEYLRGKNLTVAGNLHDVMGVRQYEDEFAAMCAAMGQSTAQCKGGINFQPMNRTYMHALDDVVVKPIGLDTMWIDWQQGGMTFGCAGFQMNPTFITNHVRATTPARTGDLQRRGDILARFGGLGNHRYPVGFTGDVVPAWECFRYQPYFTATAANVAFSSLSHDLFGPHNDHELHVRWLQFGSFAGTMRLHDRGHASGDCVNSGDCAIVEPWKLPLPFRTAAATALLTRTTLVPYIYTASHKARLSGVSVVRCLYIDFPKEAGAYRMLPEANAQYMFGDDITVAPVTTKMVGALASQPVWVPPGVWFDEVYGELLHGPATVTCTFTIHDTPRLVRAGAIIPMIPRAAAIATGAAGRSMSTIDVKVYPGAPNGSAVLIEDDGHSYAYLREGGTSTTQLTFTMAGDTTHVKVSAASGGAAQGVPAMRNVRIILVASTPLASAAVTVGGATQQLRFLRSLGRLSTSTTPGTFTYDASTGDVVADLGAVPTSQPVSIRLTAAASSTMAMTVASSAATGVASVATSRLRLMYARASLAKHYTDETQKTPGDTDVRRGFLKQAGAFAVRLARVSSPAAVVAGQFAKTLASYRPLLKSAVTGVETAATALVQMWSELSKDHTLCWDGQCDAKQYMFATLWTEGYQPFPGDPAAALPLQDYWCMLCLDNWATTKGRPSKEYHSKFSRGYLLAAPPAGAPSNDTACVTVFFNKEFNDHMTVSSPQGRAKAKAMGYTVLAGSECIGYAYTSLAAAMAGKQRGATQSPAPTARPASNDKSIQTARTLLLSALEQP